MNDLEINKAIADAYASMYNKKEEVVVEHDQQQEEARSEQFEEAKKLDPVGKEDGDIDNDGDEDASDKYLAKRRKAISKDMKGSL